MGLWFMYYFDGTNIRVKTAPITKTGNEVDIPENADWTDRGVVIVPGGPGSWDVRLHGALSPCTVIKKNGTYFLYYIAADGNRSTDGGPRHRALGVATSPDGLNFTKYGGNPIITFLPHNNEEEGLFSAGAYLDDNGDIVMYWSALDAGSPTSELVNSDGRLSVSTNGLNFIDKGEVLSHDDGGVWGHGDELFPVGTFRQGNTWYVYYIAKGVGAYWDLALAQGPVRNNIDGNTQQVLEPGSDQVKGGCDPLHISTSKVALFIRMLNAGDQVRTAAVTSPETLSSVIETYPPTVECLAVYLDVEVEPPLETENMYGVVTLQPKPSDEQLDLLKILGVNFLWIMAFDESLVIRCKNKGINCIIGIGHTDFGNTMDNVVAYMVKDEPFGLGYTLEQIIQLALDARGLTDKPIGFNFSWYRIDDAFPTLNAYVDYTITGCYPYRDNKFYSGELDEAWEEIINRVTVPVIANAQAFETANWNYPQIPPQKDFWNPKPMGSLWYVWYGGGGLIREDEVIQKGIRVTPDVEPWDTRPDFEDGTLDKLILPMGITRLEPKRLNLSGTGVYIVDAGIDEEFNWSSFQSTKPNQNIFFRDDFLDNTLEDWVVVGGSWAVSKFFLNGSGSTTWQGNRVRIGPTSWLNQDILIKAFMTSGAEMHRFFLRADHQAYNVNAYGLTLDQYTVSQFRVANGSVLENTVISSEHIAVAKWYWVRLQIYTSGGNVTGRIKWWLPQNDEPGWIASHTWTGIWRSSGCFSIGRHTNDPGQQHHYNNALISRYEGIPSPPNCSTSFKFWASDDGVNWGSYYTDITLVPDSRFLKIETTLSRDSLLSAMPTLESMNVGYSLVREKTKQVIFI